MPLVLENNYIGGVKTAGARFGIKEAFLPALLGLGASLAGPAAARWGLGRLAGGAAGQAVGGMASKLMGHGASGLGRMAFDTGAGMLAGGLANKAMGGGPRREGVSPAAGGVMGLAGGRVMPQLPWAEG